MDDIILRKNIVDEKTQMRDAVIGRLFDLSEAEEYPRICFFTADMGAEALDQWREREIKIRDGRYSEFGIAEAGMASTAAGMAKEGFRPFIYSIANFNTKRILEHHILNVGVQNLPYVTIGVGTGFSYPDSGPTHYMTEDISIMRPIPNLEIYSPSDSLMAAKLTEKLAQSKNPAYMRLERSVLPINSNPNDNLEKGFNELKVGENTAIVTTGTMVPSALKVEKEILERTSKRIGVVDVYRLKPLNERDLAETLGKYKRVITIEEHLLAGGFGSIISELKCDKNLDFELERKGIEDRFVYYYGRENIRRELGLDIKSIVKKVKEGL